MPKLMTQVETIHARLMKKLFAGIPDSEIQAFREHLERAKSDPDYACIGGSDYAPKT